MAGFGQHTNVIKQLSRIRPMLSETGAYTGETGATTNAYPAQQGRLHPKQRLPKESIVCALQVHVGLVQHS